MSIEIRVNGKTFNLFKQVNISSSLDTFSSETRIIISEAVNDDSIMKINDLVEIYLDGIQKVTGYVEKINDNESNTSHDISYRIRDRVMDIIDSSVPDNVKTIKGVTTFKQLCQLVIDGLEMDIQVIDRVGASFGKDEIKAASVGQNAYDFLQGYARKVQVFLNNDGKGNILLRRPGGTLQTLLLNIPGANNNNILDSNIDLDYSKRYGKYTVRSNSNVANDKKADNLNQVGVAIDSTIRSSRIFEKIAESPMNAEQCKQAAEEEANIRRMRSFAYNCRVVGYSANGELWEEGKLVKINDQRKGVVGLHVIKDIQYIYSEAGEFSTMSITLPDAYTVQAELDQVGQKISKNASTYTTVSGDTLSEIAARNNLTLKEVLTVNPQIQNPDIIQEGQVINIPVTGGN